MRAFAQPICEGALSAPRAQIVLGACACAAGAAVLFAFDPTHHSIYPSCLFHRATGLYCPGCGATRAAYALLHGRLLEAAQDNAVFVAALPCVLYYAGGWLRRVWHRNAWPEVPIEPRRWTTFSIAFIALMVVFMTVRNLPGAEWLCPK